MRVLTVGDSRREEAHHTEVLHDADNYEVVKDWLGYHMRVEWPAGHKPAGVDKYRSIDLIDRWAQIEDVPA